MGKVLTLYKSSEKWGMGDGTGQLVTLENPVFLHIKKKKNLVTIYYLLYSGFNLEHNRLPGFHVNGMRKPCAFIYLPSS